MADRPLFIRLSLPSGLEDTLEGLAREVLRHKPKNIYEFAADHFEELLRKRNEGNCLAHRHFLKSKPCVQLVKLTKVSKFLANRTKVVDCSI